MSRNEDTVRRIEDLLVSDRASTMLVCIHGGRGTAVSYTHLTLPTTPYV